jgi:hypothetical protein
VVSEVARPGSSGALDCRGLRSVGGGDAGSAPSSRPRPATATDGFPLHRGAGYPGREADARTPWAQESRQRTWHAAATPHRSRAGHRVSQTPPLIAAMPSWRPAGISCRPIRRRSCRRACRRQTRSSGSTGRPGMTRGRRGPFSARRIAGTARPPGSQTPKCRNPAACGCAWPAARASPGSRSPVS